MKYGDWEIIHTKRKNPFVDGEPEYWNVYFIGDKKSPRRGVCRCYELADAKAIAKALNLSDKLMELGL